MKCVNCGTEMGALEGFAEIVCTKCKANQAIIDANTPKKSLDEKSREADRQWGCIFRIAIPIIIIYFAYDYFKDYFVNPLEYKVKVEVANLRTKPNLKAGIIKKINKGEEFTLLSDSSFNNSNQEWGLGVNGKDTGWIYMQLVDK